MASAVRRRPAANNQRGARIQDSVHYDPLRKETQHCIICLCHSNMAIKSAQEVLNRKDNEKKDKDEAMVRYKALSDKTKRTYQQLLPQKIK